MLLGDLRYHLKILKKNWGTLFSSMDYNITRKRKKCVKNKYLNQLVPQTQLYESQSN